MSYWSNLWGALLGRDGQEEQQYVPLTGSAQLDALRWYYENNATYDRLATAYQGIPNSPVVKGIRTLGNPAHRVAEFYAAKLIPDEVLEGIDAKAAVKKCVEKVDKWSNWSQRQRVASRWDSIYGNVFMKAASSEDGERVYRQLLDPRHVTYFEKDDRDFFTYLRLDIPQERLNQEGEVESFTYTEVYDKERATHKAWEHEEGPDAELEEVIKEGKLVLSERLEARQGESDNGQRVDFTGFDFIPVVHIKFRDVGNPWGLGAFSHVLEAIDALNLALTRLDKMLFPKVHLFLKANMLTPEGQPVDAPALQNALIDHSEGDIDTVDVNNTLLWLLPGLSDIGTTIPPIDFASHLEAVEQKLRHLEKDLPELAYYRLRDMQEISGRAARILLGDLIDRVIEARDNFLAGLVRVNEMCLTIGKVIGLEDFQGLGSFEDGALEHSYESVDVFPISELEDAETEKAEIDNVTALMQANLIDEEEARKRLGIENAPKALPAVAASPTDATPISEALRERLGIGAQDGAQPQGQPQGNGG